MSGSLSHYGHFPWYYFFLTGFLCPFAPIVIEDFTVFPFDFKTLVAVPDFPGAGRALVPFLSLGCSALPPLLLGFEVRPVKDAFLDSAPFPFVAGLSFLSDVREGFTAVRSAFFSGAYDPFGTTCCDLFKGKAGSFFRFRDSPEKTFT